VVFECVSDDPFTIYPNTAYEVLRRVAARSSKAEEEAMKDSKHEKATVRPKIDWTPEDRARHKAIRDKFREWHPSPEELIASGEGTNVDLHGEYRDLRPFVEEIKRAREAAGLTLTEVSVGPLSLETGTTRIQRSTCSGVMLSRSVWGTISAGNVPHTRMGSG
jgi:hypothetical protein